MMSTVIPVVTLPQVLQPLRGTNCKTKLYYVISFSAQDLKGTAKVPALDLLRHYHPQRLCSFWSAPRIMTSGEVKFSEHAQRVCFVFSIRFVGFALSMSIVTGSL